MRFSFPSTRSGKKSEKSSKRCQIKCCWRIYIDRNLRNRNMQGGHLRRSRVIHLLHLSRFLWVVGSTTNKWIAEVFNTQQCDLVIPQSINDWRMLGLWNSLVFCTGSVIDGTSIDLNLTHSSDVIMSVMASQITSVSSVCLTVSSGANQRKYQSSASLAFVRGIHRWPVDSPHKGSVTRKMFHVSCFVSELSSLRRVLLNKKYSYHDFLSICIFKYWQGSYMLCRPKNIGYHITSGEINLGVTR